MPPMMHRLSGSIVAVRLCCRAASPAGVRGNFSPGRSLAIFPPGTVSRVPFQYPLKSGCPSAILGAGFGFADLLSTAVNGLSWARHKAAEQKRHKKSPRLFMQFSLRILAGAGAAV